MNKSSKDKAIAICNMFDIEFETLPDGLYIWAVEYDVLSRGEVKQRRFIKSLKALGAILETQ